MGTAEELGAGGAGTRGLRGLQDQRTTGLKKTQLNRPPYVTVSEASRSILPNLQAQLRSAQSMTG